VENLNGSYAAVITVAYRRAPEQNDSQQERMMNGIAGIPATSLLARTRLWQPPVLQ